jgi:hypothetical protein
MPMLEPATPSLDDLALGDTNALPTFIYVTIAVAATVWRFESIPWDSGGFYGLYFVAVVGTVVFVVLGRQLSKADMLFASVVLSEGNERPNNRTKPDEHTTRVTSTLTAGPPKPAQAVVRPLTTTSA